MERFVERSEQVARRLLLVVHHLLRWIHLEALDSINDKGSENSGEQPCLDDFPWH
jgi:uncharacterized alpha-E superfamily protein